MEYKDIFIKRLEELGITPDQYNVTAYPNNEHKFDIKVDDTLPLLLLHQISHMILGMIYHFTCRKWITGHSYVYIMKSFNTITFNDGTTETE